MPAPRRHWYQPSTMLLPICLALTVTVGGLRVRDRPRRAPTGLLLLDRVHHQPRGRRVPTPRTPCVADPRRRGRRMAGTTRAEFPLGPPRPFEQCADGVNRRHADRSGHHRRRSLLRRRRRRHPSPSVVVWRRSLLPRASSPPWPIVRRSSIGPHDERRLGVPTRRRLPDRVPAVGAALAAAALGAVCVGGDVVARCDVAVGLVVVAVGQGRSGLGAASAPGRRRRVGVRSGRPRPGRRSSGAGLGAALVRVAALLQRARRRGRRPVPRCVGGVGSGQRDAGRATPQATRRPPGRPGVAARRVANDVGTEP